MDTLTVVHLETFEVSPMLVPMPKMKATIFVEPGRIVLDEKPIPDIGPLDALIRITTTTICERTSISSRANIRSPRA